MRLATYWVEIEDLNRRYEGRYLPTSAILTAATVYVHIVWEISTQNLIQRLAATLIFKKKI